MKEDKLLGLIHSDGGTLQTLPVSESVSQSVQSLSRVQLFATP